MTAPGPAPCFVLAADDVLAPVLVRFWADLVESHYRRAGLTMTPTVAAARVLALQMEDWQKTHGAKVVD